MGRPRPAGIAESAPFSYQNGRKARLLAGPSPATVPLRRLDARGQAEHIPGSDQGGVSRPGRLWAWRPRQHGLPPSACWTSSSRFACGAAACPVMALVSLAIVLDSRGPLLFCQRRSGLNGKIFGILKFRSMHVLEDGAQIVQACQNDARITRVGRVMRRLSLDELPQLFNVIAGDMSLVGPRPHAVAHDDYYGAAISNYVLRQRVKPGITGWAQVNGARGATPTLDVMQRRVDLDAWYVAHASLMLDLTILAPHASGSVAQQGRALMRLALSLPARYEVSPPRPPSGRQRLLCRSHGGRARHRLPFARRPGAHDAAGLSATRRTNPVAIPSWSSPPMAMPSRWPPVTRAFRFAPSAGRHHSCRRPGRGVRLAPDRKPDTGAQRHHRFHS